ncbi:MULTISPECIES: YggS family pyridoxal phosphate-dependent enzyme [unclassified Shewanella]|uniref:YggS family pyridoxal phosphate-dependent enzyme n=1 Tax=unclassified Shewanella TaxID=196818 RepID=UPI000C84DBA6|nr:MULTISPECIES: YggS family pyridoxal phosphate-dependent enzyme [unclassified Shewanella]MDO6639209.1 YggS family pyridoxal phosphate-dependent enzyme [Shewanella sp. 5_MG-2023]MDO6680333.1 YggS family pyridoxal phosphate-dependent enzyme [Shewanella sp. 4_MG-2023]MDO6776624.1 YggS family pyridoxal phosphate-dependent enzyme [Shewanella sp. 3_MG-2023]PMG31502.1 YggS family pyridoxal phosphate enzyme [Shewanella sp. 10N.286.52.C2]PMG40617.1 YggS family pyridoxal phosphate enzyme [Shewanella s
MTTIADRISIAQSQIAQATQNCSRNSEEVTLLAVSKTKPISAIIEAYQAGQRCFGENYVQEGEEKVLALKDDYCDIEWHFIGPLQSNKSRIVAEHFDWMHTLSREKIAKRLNDQRPAGKAPLQVCIQVNISEEASKSGVIATEVSALAKVIASLPNLTLRGLMAIPTATSDIALQRQEFAKLQQLFAQLKSQYPDIDTLSMGMSNDLAVAIEHGSTMVRIGTAIFGARDYP